MLVEDLPSPVGDRRAPQDPSAPTDADEQPHTTCTELGGGQHSRCGHPPSQPYVVQRSPLRDPDRSSPFSTTFYERRAIPIGEVIACDEKDSRRPQRSRFASISPRGGIVRHRSTIDPHPPSRYDDTTHPGAWGHLCNAMQRSSQESSDTNGPSQSHPGFSRTSSDAWP